MDGRVLYRVRAGQHFGESVLTGRRRPATHRAAGMCEMLTISADDLSDLIHRRPKEGRLIVEEVLEEHKRKERLRNLSLKLTVNRLGEARGLDAAALRVQMAWDHKVEEMVTGAALDFEPDVEPSLSESLAARTVTVSHHASSAGSAERTSTTRSASRSDGVSSKVKLVGEGGQLDMNSVSRLVNRLEKADELMERLEKLVTINSERNQKGKRGFSSGYRSGQSTPTSQGIAA